MLIFVNININHPWSTPAVWPVGSFLALTTFFSFQSILHMQRYLFPIFFWTVAIASLTWGCSGCRGLGEEVRGAPSISPFSFLIHLCSEENLSEVSCKSQKVWSYQVEFLTCDSVGWDVCVERGQECFIGLSSFDGGWTINTSQGGFASGTFPRLHPSHLCHDSSFVLAGEG